MFLFSIGLDGKSDQERKNKRDFKEDKAQQGTYSGCDYSSTHWVIAWLPKQYVTTGIFVQIPMGNFQFISIWVNGLSKKNK